MAETTVENQICNACGAEARPNTLFCYNCGESLAPNNSDDPKPDRSVSNAWFRENIAEERNGDKPGETQPLEIIETAEKPIPKPPLPEEAKLKSAAAMRRKSKVYQPKKEEVIWEEYDAPNKWFIFAAVLITLFAVGILFLAVHLR